MTEWEDWTAGGQTTKQPWRIFRPTVPRYSGVKVQSQGSENG